MPPGYYRYPTIHGDTVAFVSEDDLWTVNLAEGLPTEARRAGAAARTTAKVGGVARRLTANLGEVMSPSLSPDGALIAFAGKEEGPPEVYVMRSAGGPARRLTYLGASLLQVAGWTPDGKSVLFWANAQQPFFRWARLFAVPREGGLPREEAVGPAMGVAHGPRGARVIQRFGFDPARWKRYRGGRAGVLLIDPDGRGTFRRLVDLKGNLCCPIWIGSRICFLSDHEGVGNLYSCTPSGSDLKRHTDHWDYYARNATSDGKRIVYHAGGDLFLFDGERSRRIDVDYPSPRVQRNRKYVDAGRALEDYAPTDKSIALTTRGRLFTMAAWEGPVEERGAPRMRLARWLHDQKRLVAVTDQGGQESPQIFPGGKRLRAQIGRAIDMEASPAGDLLAVSNHRHELVLVDLKRDRDRVLDRSKHDRIAGLAWSPDGRWIAYGFPESPHLLAIKLVDVKTGRSRAVTRPVLRDVSPVFDPDGKYLYFLSYREFDPVYDNLHFDLGFPRGVRPYLVTLRKDLPSPFTTEPPEAPKDGAGKKREKFRIDFDGIEDRVLAFPVGDGRYDRIDAIPGAVLWTVWPVEGSLNLSWYPSEPPAKALLEKYDLAKRKKETLVSGVSGFRIGGKTLVSGVSGFRIGGKTLVYRAGSRLRWLKAGEKPDEKTDKDPPGRDSGWLDLGRLRVLVEPPVEWAQMYREAWRLMRDHFWVEDMSGVDWEAVYRRYQPLLDRVGTRSEFSDLIWEMQGELGTSHCYEMGGDYRPEPRYDVGRLAAEFVWAARGWRVSRIAQGDPWDEKARSPLAAPGVNLRVGDVITAVNGRPVSRIVTPHELLLNCADAEVTLTLANGRTVAVKALRDETRVRYREWVERNRRWVRERTKGRVGYVHIPDMGPPGYAEFHRGYLSEVDREALIVDVRNNGGGHVSQLLLEKLARKRVGYDVCRWGQPRPYPDDSPRGPMVALTNESAGSDGDIFSHCWKLLELGPLIGRRTWGGVVGIWPRHALADGSVTTQPEFSFWFKDVSFGVENYGTDPDIDVDILPQDFAKGRDPQIEKAVEVALSLLSKHESITPPMDGRPNLALPRPPRAKAKT